MTEYCSITGTVSLPPAQLYEVPPATMPTDFCMKTFAGEIQVVVKEEAILRKQKTINGRVTVWGVVVNDDGFPFLRADAIILHDQDGETLGVKHKIVDTARKMVKTLPRWAIEHIQQETK